MLYHHLPHAVALMRAEPNWRRWGPLIAQIPEHAREECTTYLRQEAKKRQLWERVKPSASSSAR